eukprot:SAG31_NODE_822_length_11777_cov_11.328738_3_plen_85_part_00
MNGVRLTAVTGVVLVVAVDWLVQIWTKMMLTDFWGLRLHTVTGEDRTPALHPTWQCLAANQHGDKGAQKRSDEPNPVRKRKKCR